MIVCSEIVVNSAIFTASMSDEKYHRISLNFFSEILEKIIYLFFNLVTLFTHKSINKIIVFVLAVSFFRKYVFEGVGSNFLANSSCIVIGF